MACAVLWVTPKEEKRDIFSVVVMGDMREELMKGKIQERRRAELKLFRREQSSMIVCCRKFAGPGAIAVQEVQQCVTVCKKPGYMNSFLSF